VRFTGAVSMYLIAQNVLKPRHKIVDERAELYKCMEAGAYTRPLFSST